MATVTLKGNLIHTSGELPTVGSKAPPFELVKSDLSTLNLNDHLGKKIILNIFPSLDTDVCAQSVRHFNEAAAQLPDVVILCISKDLPFAHGRFCTTEGIDKVIPVSAFRANFGRDYGLEIIDGPIRQLLARSVIILDPQGKIIYEELVPEIGQEPNYDKALKAVSH